MTVHAAIQKLTEIGKAHGWQTPVKALVLALPVEPGDVLEPSGIEVGRSGGKPAATIHLIKEPS
jgi:hypothetical protein